MPTSLRRYDSVRLKDALPTVIIISLILSPQAQGDRRLSACVAEALQLAYDEVLTPKKHSFRMETVSERRLYIQAQSIKPVDLVGFPMDFETSMAMLIELTPPSQRANLLASIERLETRRAWVHPKIGAEERGRFKSRFPKTHPFTPTLTDKGNIIWPTRFIESEHDLYEVLSQAVDVLGTPDYTPVRQLSVLFRRPRRFLTDNLDAMTEKIIRQYRLAKRFDPLLPQGPELGAVQDLIEGLMRTYLIIPIARPFSQIDGLQLNAKLFQIIKEGGAPALRAYLKKTRGPGMALRYSLTLFTSVNGVAIVTITAALFAEYPAIRAFFSEFTNLDVMTPQGREDAIDKLQSYIRNPRRLLKDMREQCAKSTTVMEADRCLKAFDDVDQSVLDRLQQAMSE